MTLELTGDQQKKISSTTGLELRVLRYTRQEAAGAALLAAAVTAGHASPTSRRLIEFDLTAPQVEALETVIGGGVPTRWLVGIDHMKVRYAEDWSSMGVAPLGTRGLVVPASEEGPHGDKLLVRLADLGGDAVVFGTGRHAATRLAAQLLDDHLQPGDRVIDVGTGSGVLAVFAVRLGASHVRAIDTSPAAIEAARRTAELNGCSDQLELIIGELGEDGPPADLVVANILVGVLLDLMPILAANVRPGGLLITSGVVDARAAEVVSAAGACGLQHSRSSSAGGWTASAFRSADG